MKVKKWDHIQEKNTSQPRKRRFNGNQFKQATNTSNSEDIQQQEEPQQQQHSSVSVTDSQTDKSNNPGKIMTNIPQLQSASAKKLKLNLSVSSDEAGALNVEGNVIFNTSIIKNFLEEIGKCPTQRVLHR